MHSDDLIANLNSNFRRSLDRLAGPHQDESYPLNEVFNEFASAIGARAFKDLWTPEQWALIDAFDTFQRDAIAKYSRLPPWHQFWKSSAGIAIATEARELREALSAKS